jgi:tRNA threonylcarbamoyladenosine biosynthesis protein TsaB
MRILAIDTATARTAVALLDTAAEPASLVTADDDPADGARPNHARAVLGLVEEVLGKSNTVDRIAVGIGPGTFTGLRIGIASAQALARGFGCELVGVSTLASLEFAARQAHPDINLLTVIDARRGEAFVAGTGLAPAVIQPEELGVLASGRLAVGDGAIKFRAELERGGAVVPPDDDQLHEVQAAFHCLLGAQITQPKPVQPLYLRVPDAELRE